MLFVAAPPEAKFDAPHSMPATASPWSRAWRTRRSPSTRGGISHTFHKNLKFQKNRNFENFKNPHFFLHRTERYGAGSCWAQAPSHSLWVCAFGARVAESDIVHLRPLLRGQEPDRTTTTAYGTALFEPLDACFQEKVTVRCKLSCR